MEITFWGVRGTVPSPGRHTCRYGGNTSCVSLELPHSVLILDAGTGIIPLGETLVGTVKEVYILLTHLHADHIAGFPFFAPLHTPGHRITLFTYPHRGVPWSLLSMLDGCHFPLRPFEIEGEVSLNDVYDKQAFRAGDFEITRHPVNHPGGAFAYRVEHRGKAFVFAPDSELEPVPPPMTTMDALADFCRGADVLAHDAQYLPEDFPRKAGWGHSTLQRACDLAVLAGVKYFIPFHHDPWRTDDELDRMEAMAQARLGEHGIGCTMAREGLRIRLGTEVEVLDAARTMR